MRLLVVLTALACLTVALGAAPVASATHARSPCSWWQGTISLNLQWTEHSAPDNVRQCIEALP